MYIGIDLGHTRIKGTIYDENFGKIAFRSEKTKVQTPNGVRYQFLFYGLR